MSQPVAPLQRLLAIMAQLRDPEHGCPWDLRQDFASIVPHTIEEAYEVADAIAQGDPAAIQDELGDLLFQVVFYAQLGREQGWFGFDEIASGVADKLVRRHPHVFADVKMKDEQAVKAQWEHIKQTERDAKRSQNKVATESVFDGVPSNLPGLLHALKLQKRCANVGFDWDHIEDVLAKVREEADEVEAELKLPVNPADEGASQVDIAKVEEEIGDLLFAVVNLSRHLRVNPESAIRKANQKFARRFQYIETQVSAAGGRLQDYSLAELEALWQQAKQS